MSSEKIPQAAGMLRKEVWRLAIPNIVSNISVPLLSTVDTVLMGRLSPVFLGAVGISSMIFNFLYWNFGFLRMGTTGITAQYYGAQDRKEMVNTLWRALMLGLSVAVLLFVLQRPLANLAVLAFQVSPEQVEMVETYFFIRIWEAPAYMVFLTLTGWFFGVQNALYPLVLTVVVNAVNIIISYIFVVYLHWEISGVAWGTVIAQYFGMVVGVILFFVKYGKWETRFRWGDLVDIAGFMSFIRINKDLFFRTILITSVFAFFYSQSSTFGVISLAVSVVLMQFINWMSYGIDGLAFAAESIVGKYKGAGDVNTTEKVIRIIFSRASLFALAFAGLYGLAYQGLFRIFTDDPEVIAAGLDYRFWMILIPLTGFASYVWDGVFIGLTASKSMRNAVILPALLFVTSFYMFRNHLGLHALMLALCLFLAARGIIQTKMYRKKGVDLP